MILTVKVNTIRRLSPGGHARFRQAIGRLVFVEGRFGRPISGRVSEFGPPRTSGRRNSPARFRGVPGCYSTQRAGRDAASFNNYDSRFAGVTNAAPRKDKVSLEGDVSDHGYPGLVTAGGAGDIVALQRRFCNSVRPSPGLSESASSNCTLASRQSPLSARMIP